MMTSNLSLLRRTSTPFFLPARREKVLRDGSRWPRPGNLRNGSGVAALLALARDVKFAHSSRSAPFFGRRVGAKTRGAIFAACARIWLPKAGNSTQCRADALRTDHVTTNALVLAGSKP